MDAQRAKYRIVTATDPALWCVRRVFGAAGGPDEIALTAEGMERAFSVGAQVRRGAPALALEALATVGGEASLSVRNGARLSPTDLGRRFDQAAWGVLRSLGYVEGLDTVHLTAAGKRAVEDGAVERRRLLARCRRAAGTELTP